MSTHGRGFVPVTTAPGDNHQVRTAKASAWSQASTTGPCRPCRPCRPCQPDDGEPVCADRAHRRPRTLTAGAQCRGMHEDPADAAVVLKGQANDEQGGLSGDDDAHRVVEGEAAGRLPGLGCQQLVDVVQQALLLVGGEQPPDREMRSETSLQGRWVEPSVSAQSSRASSSHTAVNTCQDLRVRRSPEEVRTRRSRLAGERRRRAATAGCSKSGDRFRNHRVFRARIGITGCGARAVD